jgi:hypothetical protein
MRLGSWQEGEQGLPGTALLASEVMSISLGVPARLPIGEHQDRGESKRGRSLPGDRLQRYRHPNRALLASAWSFL